MKTKFSIKAAIAALAIIGIASVAHAENYKVTYHIEWADDGSEVRASKTRVFKADSESEIEEAVCKQIGFFMTRASDCVGCAKRVSGRCQIVVIEDYEAAGQGSKRDSDD